MTEQKVQLNQGQSGALVRTAEVKALQADGTVAAVETQMVTLTDADGNPIALSNLEHLLQQLLDSNRQILSQLRGGL